MAATQREIDLHEFKAGLLAQGKSVVGADAAFNKEHPAQQYAMGEIVSAIPKDAIAHLRANPNLATHFDKQFGAGTAEFVLGAKVMAEETNPFARFLAPPDAASAGEAANPFAQFVPGADASPSKEAAPATERRPLSKIIHVTEFGMPIFEDEADKTGPRKAVMDLYKGIPGGVVRGLRDIPDASTRVLTPRLGSDLACGVRS